MNKNILNIAGRTFGRLTAIEISGRNVSGEVIWRCSCACGGACTALGHRLRNGYTSHCGCLAAENRARGINPPPASTAKKKPRRPAVSVVDKFLYSYPPTP